MKSIDRKHEEFLADLYAGRRTKGSGNQFNSQTDVRQSRYEVPFAYAMEAKATEHASHAVSDRIWAKLVDQAHGENPLYAVRLNALAIPLDLIIITPHHHLELIEWAEQGWAKRDG